MLEPGGKQRKIYLCLRNSVFFYETQFLTLPEVVALSTAFETICHVFLLKVALNALMRGVIEKSDCTLHHCVQGRHFFRQRFLVGLSKIIVPLTIVSSHNCYSRGGGEGGEGNRPPLEGADLFRTLLSLDPFRYSSITCHDKTSVEDKKQRLNVSITATKHGHSEYGC